MTQFKLFLVPVMSSEPDLSNLNRFLSSHRIHRVQKNFIPDGGNSCWSFCVSYQVDSESSPKTIKKQPRVDYKQLLNEEQFAFFSRLRDVRKSLAERDGVPVYMVFSNEQLYRFVKDKVSSLKQMQEIEGIGKAKTSAYGEAFLQELVTYQKSAIKDVDAKTNKNLF